MMDAECVPEPPPPRGLKSRHWKVVGDKLAPGQQPPTSPMHGRMLTNDLRACSPSPAPASDLRGMSATTTPVLESSSADSDVVLLNVGGRHFTTTREILTRREPSSLFHAILSGRWPGQVKDEHGAVRFNEQCSETFEFLLQYLRDGVMPFLPQENLRQVLKDAEFFQFTHLLPCAISVPDVDWLEEADLLFMLEHQPPPRDLSRICLSLVTLQHKQLERTNLQEAVLIGAQLDGSDLSNSILSRAQFLFCSMEHADLRSCTMDGGMRMVSCVLRRSNLHGLDFRELRLKNVDLSGAILCNCNLQGVDMSGFKLNQVNFTGARMERAKLHNAQLQGAMFNDAKLRGTSFDGAEAPGCDFAGADMVKAVFDRANLRGSNFMPWLPTFVSSGDGVLRIAVNHKSSVLLNEASFVEAILDGAILSLGASAASRYWTTLAYRYVSPSKPRFDLTVPTRVKSSLLDVTHPLSTYLAGREFRLDFEDADAEASEATPPALRLSGMGSLNMRGASLVGAIIENASLPGANLEHADLRRALLSGTSMMNSNMRSALLQAQDLSGVDLSGANLDEANLTNADLTKMKALPVSFTQAVFIRARVTPQMREILIRGKGILSKPPNSQFLDGFPMIMSRPASARTEGSSKAWT